MSAQQPSIAPPRVCILIKALNEEARIAACLESAVREAASVNGEVILVDSLSTDRTVEVARRFAVRIVQFANADDCGCGAAVQLGYQYVRGDFIYLLDGDMVLQPGFLQLALAQFGANPRLAGVGGKLLDSRIQTASDRRRAGAAAQLLRAAEVHELGGGGMYRRAAIEQVGYLAHRGLAAFEEADLGVRLRAARWTLLRIPELAVVHEGHAEDNLGMIRRLWRNRRAQATGAFLRASLGRPGFFLALRKQGHVVLAFALHLLLPTMLAGGASMGTAVSAWALAWLVLTLIMVVRKRSVTSALWSVVLWNYFAAAALLGLLQPLGSPAIPIQGKVLAWTDRSDDLLDYQNLARPLRDDT